MTTIKLRRGLSTAFSTNNPVLAAGEPAFATDTGVLKIGDGATAYNNLPSIGASPDLSNYVQKTDYASTSAAGVVKVDGSTVTINANGVISAAGSAPSNMVTTDTQQTISGVKTWTGQQFINGGVEFGYTYTNRSRGAFNFGAGSANQPNAVISPNGYIDLTGYGNATTNNIRLDYYTTNALTIRRQVASGTIDNGVFNVWSGNTAAASSTRFKVDNTGVTVNDSKVLTESTGVKSSDIRNIVKLTQAAYDALATKDANTFYVIIPASS